MHHKRAAVLGAVVALSLGTVGLGIANAGNGVGRSATTNREASTDYLRLAVEPAEPVFKDFCTYKVIGARLAPGTKVFHYFDRPTGPGRHEIGLVGPNGGFSGRFVAGPHYTDYVTASTPYSAGSPAIRVQIKSNTVACVVQR
jgi:hypothetical protein